MQRSILVYFISSRRNPSALWCRGCRSWCSCRCLRANRACAGRSRGRGHGRCRWGILWRGRWGYGWIGRTSIRPVHCSTSRQTTAHKALTNNYRHQRCRGGLLLVGIGLIDGIALLGTARQQQAGQYDAAANLDKIFESARKHSPNYYFYEIRAVMWTHCHSWSFRAPEPFLIAR